MPVKAQFFKCGLCVVLYFIIYIVFIELKRSFDFKKVTSMTIKYQPQIRYSSIANRIIKKDIELEIKLLQADELKGETIDLEESAALLRRVSDTCVRYNLKTPFVKRHFLYNAKHKSLYCWIRKVASTSFTKLFSDMSNRPINHNIYREVDFLSPETMGDLQRFAYDHTIFKLLIVRHPFQRLVSSYRDRIEDNSRYTAQAWLYAYPILYFSRPKFFHSNTSNGNILQKIFKADRRLKVVPSFREFIKWLLRQPPDHDDVHWAQYHTHCAICNMNYNFILKLDKYTLGEANYVLSKLKLNKNKIYLPRLQRTRAGLTNFDVTCRYFRNLTTDIVIQLYERYKIDFEMYTYDLDKYLQCTIKN